MLQRIVIKLGGSLLDNKDWSDRLLSFLDSCGQHQFFLIVGGGEVIEAMRLLDRVHALDQVAMHWRCVDMLKATTDIALELLHRSNRGLLIDRISTSDDFYQHCQTCALEYRAGLHVIDSSAFYNIHDEPAIRMGVEFTKPSAGWATTTDAIAIFAATLLHADRCILLKSCEVNPNWSIAQLVQTGVVDPECIEMSKSFKNISVQKL